MTPLEKIQKKIDKCNNKCGCDSKCSLTKQKACSLLQSHAQRIEQCRKWGDTYLALVIQYKIIAETQKGRYNYVQW